MQHAKMHKTHAAKSTKNQKQKAKYNVQKRNYAKRISIYTTVPLKRKRRTNQV